jgi:hypothetical protein
MTGAAVEENQRSMLKNSEALRSLEICTPLPYHDHDLPPSFRCYRSLFVAAPTLNLSSLPFDIR